LAELEPKPYRKLEWMEQGTAAGRRAVGETYFKEFKGAFWRVIETRPCMRAYAAVAEVSWALGDRAGAIAIYTEMLCLNPGDNQGVRHLLAMCLLEERKSDAQASLQDLLQRFPEDAAANRAYSQALLHFHLAGEPTEQANQALSAALRANPIWLLCCWARPLCSLSYSGSLYLATPKRPPNTWLLLTTPGNTPPVHFFG